ncbi:MAG TPA: DUF4389 domain-containing protein [Gaiellaceae bacterium]|nr:DUF4389 domain-containing protein [Gaiellaceae bacterium]
MTPVSFEIERPAAFKREHVFLRVAVFIVVGWVGHPWGLLWLGLPLVAAILVSQKGGQRYLDENGPAVTRVLNWILDLAAYLALLTDELPGGSKHAVRFQVERSGSPTVGSVLLRILWAIPSLIVLAILSFVGAIVWLIAAVSVLVDERYGEGLWRFLAGLVRWEAHLLAYLASLVDDYPPFTLASGSVSPA